MKQKTAPATTSNQMNGDAARAEIMAVGRLIFGKPVTGVRYIRRNDQLHMEIEFGNLTLKAPVKVSHSRADQWCEALWNMSTEYCLYTTDELFTMYDPKGATKTSLSSFGRALRANGFRSVPAAGKHVRLAKTKKTVWWLPGECYPAETPDDLCSVGGVAARYTHERKRGHAKSLALDVVARLSR